MTAEMEKVLARVRKLLALVNDAAASEGERDNALRMAHATLAKHNLTKAEAEAAGTAPAEARVRDADAESDGAPWIRRATYGVAKLFFCEYYVISRRDTAKIRHAFIGRESNVITAKEIVAYVVRSIHLEAKKEQRDRGESGSFIRAFCKGAADRVWVRCAKLREEAEAASRPTSTGTSLVLASVYQLEAAANQALMAQLAPDLKTAKNREKKADTEAYLAGHAFGDRVSLNRQLSSEKARAQLK